MIISFYIIVSVLLITGHLVICDEGFVGVSYEKIYGSFKIDIQVSDKKQYALLCLDMSNNYTWISYYLYRRHLSSSLEIINNDTHFHLLNERIPSHLFKERLGLYNSINKTLININDFIFYYPKINVPAHIGIDSIGIGCYYENTDFSFLHLLYKHNVINYKSFMFIPKSLNKGNVYFGKVERDVIHKEFKYEIDVYDTKRIKWNVWFGGVEHGSFVYQKEDNIYFDCKEDFILAPMDYIEYLNNTVFKNYIEKRICEVMNNTMIKSVYYYCKCEEIKESEDVVFRFGKVGVVVKFMEMFEKDYDMCFYLIRNNYKNEEWVFGNAFLSLFPMEFDYEKKKVVIYSNTEFKERSCLFQDNFNIKEWYLGLFLVCLIGVCHVSYVMWKVKKEF